MIMMVWINSRPNEYQSSLNESEIKLPQTNETLNFYKKYLNKNWPRQIKPRIKL